MADEKALLFGAGLFVFLIVVLSHEGVTVIRRGV